MLDHADIEGSRQELLKELAIKTKIQKTIKTGIKLGKYSAIGRGN